MNTIINLTHGILYQVSRRIACIFFFPFYKPTILGINNIPRKGSVILCGTHTNEKDLFLLPIAVPRTVHWLVKKELFDGKAGWFFRATGHISVDRYGDTTSAKQRAIACLTRGKAIGIYPEGTINREKTTPILPFHFGAVSFAKKTSAPLIPFAILGTYQKRSGNLTLKFGEPFYVGELDLEEANARLQDAVIRLMKTNI